MAVTQIRRVVGGWLFGGRPLGEFSKVQVAYSRLIRNRSFQLRRLGQSPKAYLNIGCGRNIDPRYLNLDYTWRPGIDLCWDVTRGIPCADESVQGIFTEHCLEHISYESCVRVASEMFRVLRPGGVARIIVPDAEIYLDLYQSWKNGKDVRFPYGIGESISPVASVNYIFLGHGHRFIYDFYTLKQLLESVGFVEVRKVHFGQGLDPRLLIDQASRAIESLYVEAVKPASER